MNNKPFYLSDEHTRSFGGKLTGFESREEAIREKKHLKAYLAGKTFFNYGFETVLINPLTGEVVEEGGMQFRRPKRYKVNEIWTPKNN